MSIKDKIKHIGKKVKKSPNEKLDTQITKEFRAVAKRLDRDDITEYIQYLRNPWKIWWHNFFAGLARGLGFVIGATILVSIFVWIFVTLLPSIPWIGDFFTWINDNIDISAIDGLVRSISRISNLLEEQIDLLQQIVNNLQ